MLLVAGLAANAAAPADPALMITPTRLVLDADRSAGQVNVVNQGDEPAVIRVSIVNRHMTDDGRLVPADEPRAGERFAEDMLQFAPRRFRLPPRGGQTVRILARRPGDLARGEYRSHLAFQVEPSADKLGPRKEGDGRADDMEIRLIPVYGISIPVIVRHGELAAETRISNIEVQSAAEAGGQPTVSFVLQRRGNASVYGDVRVTHQRADGSRQEVAYIRGIAVYPPLTSRRVTLPLEHRIGSSGGGRLRVEYVDHDDTDHVIASRVATMR